jgi:hypothetical protein
MQQAQQQAVPSQPGAPSDPPANPAQQAEQQQLVAAAVAAVLPRPGKRQQQQQQPAVDPIGWATPAEAAAVAGRLQMLAVRVVQEVRVSVSQNCRSALPDRNRGSSSGSSTTRLSQ